MPKIIKVGDQEVIAALTAEDLQSLLRAPLARLRISTPSLEECRELVIWTGSGPFGSIERKQYTSAKPHRYLTSFKGSLDEVKAYYEQVLDFGVKQAATDAAASLVRQSAEHEVFAPLRRLREALAECEPLCRENPPPYSESWELSAHALRTVFGWVVARSGSNAPSGLSKGGPAMSFVCAALETQGWRKGNVPTEDAILQYLKRNRSTRDN